MEIPTWLPKDRIEHVISRLEPFQAMLAHRLGKVTSFVSQMMLLGVSSFLGSKKNLITVERGRKLSPGVFAESSSLYNVITDENRMEVRLKLSRLCALGNIFFYSPGITILSQPLQRGCGRTQRSRLTSSNHPGY